MRPPTPSCGGLSPRVRGKLEQVRGEPVRERSIPACAGEAPAHQSECWGEWVYPRVCGGSIVQQSVTLGDEGLSPRVRGKLYETLDALDGLRSIPACAGEA